MVLFLSDFVCLFFWFKALFCDKEFVEDIDSYGKIVLFPTVPELCLVRFVGVSENAVLLNLKASIIAQ